MPRRPAAITQADVARAIRAAKQEGATEIEVRTGGATIIIRLTPAGTEQTTLAPSGEIVL